MQPRSADYLQRIALALACQDPTELMRVTAVEHIPRMIAEAAWLVESVGDSALLREMKADPNVIKDPQAKMLLDHSKLFVQALQKLETRPSTTSYGV